MIKVSATGVNPDEYVYKTNLKFGDEVASRILNQVNQNLSFFERRIKYNDGRTMASSRDLIHQIGIEKAREIYRRKNQVLAQFPNEDFIEFKQYFCGPQYDELILDTVPEFLKTICPGEPKPILQVSDSEEKIGLLPPHCGHKRLSSMFMLLQGSGQITKWYRKTAPFEVISPLHIPDLDKIEEVVTAELEPNIWYVFNHRAWHSVHRFEAGALSRVSIGIDFDSISAPDLVKLTKQYE
ncbi:hypothetical protein H7Y21_00040 [Arenimonas sp.]|nr:hypothetical protein [Candidatus Parcubacteria bacterium]